MPVHRIALPLALAAAFASFLSVASVSPAVAAQIAASTVTRTGFEPHTGDYTYTVSTYAYTAGAGEINAPVVALSADGKTLTVRDPGVTVSAGEGCTAVDEHAASCVVAGQLIGEGISPAVTLALGDGDDVLGAVDPGNHLLAVDAGPGADRIEAVSGLVAGGEGDDILRGSASGRSVTLDGGPGDDELTGGPADDTLTGGPGRDRIDGAGGSRDHVSWAEETRPVTIDLAVPGPAGPADEPDDVRNVESASGGAAADVLRGTEGPNVLNGLGGDDLLVGRGGDDGLQAGDGSDRVDAGAGRDEVIAGDLVVEGAEDTLDGGPGPDRIYSLSGGSVLTGGGGADELEFGPGAARVDGGPGDDHFAGPFPRVARNVDPSTCGGGRDVVDQVALAPVLPADCELLRLDVDEQVDVSTRVSLVRGGTRLDVPMPNLCETTERCRMRLEVRAGGILVGRASRTLPRGGRPSRVVLRLTPGGRRALRGRSSVRLRFRSQYGGTGLAATLTLRR